MASLHPVDQSTRDAIEWAGPRADLAPVGREVRLLLLDSLACAVAGLRHEPVAALVSAADPGDATFPGLGSTAAPAEIARILTVASCWDEFCAGHAGAHGRPGLHSVGPAVALAGEADLGTVLNGVLAGYNTGARYGSVWLTMPGLHVDGGWGVTAAAAAAARMMDLSDDEAVTAVRVAASMPGISLYAAVPDGATARNLFAAEAVVRGIASARAAAAGFTGPPDAVSTSAQLLGQAAPHPTWTDQPLRDGYLKLWPGVRHTHYAVEAALRWRETYGQPSGPLTLSMHPSAVKYTGLRAPHTLLQRQFSSTWCAAYALVHGRVDLDAFDSGEDPAVAVIEESIELVSDDPGPGRWAQIAGPAGVVKVDTVPGDPQAPATEAQVRDKALALLHPRMGPRAGNLVDFLLSAPLDSPWQDCPH